MRRTVSSPRPSRAVARAVGGCLAAAALAALVAGCADTGDRLGDLKDSLSGGFGRNTDTYGTSRRPDVYGASTSPSLPTIGTGR